MVIVVRNTVGNDIPLGATPLGWDENRVDINDLTDQAIRGLSPAVCTLVPKKLLTRDVSKNDALESLGDLRIKPMSETLDMAVWEVIGKLVKKKCRQLQIQFGSEAARDREMQELLDLPWPNNVNQSKTKADLMCKFQDQPTMGSSSGFHVGSGIVVTAAHCVSDNVNFNMSGYAAVFNLRREDTKTSTSEKGPTPAPAKYQFDVAFDIERVLLHNGKSSGDPQPKKYPTHFDLINMLNLIGRPVGRENPTHDLCLLQLKPRASTPGWPIAVSLARDISIQNPELFVMGSPQSLVLKCSSHGEKLRAPRLLTRPQAMMPNLAVDIDTFGGNSGGPLFARTGPGQPISVIGVVHSSYSKDWGLSSQDSTMLASENKSLLKLATDWINNKVGENWLKANNGGRPLMIDSSYFTTYGYYSYYEKHATIKKPTVDCVRMSENSPLWKDHNHFNRVDVLYPLLKPLSDYTKIAEGTPQCAVKVSLTYGVWVTTVDFGPYTIVASPTLIPRSGGEIQCSATGQRLDPKKTGEVNYDLSTNPAIATNTTKLWSVVSCSRSSKSTSPQAPQIAQLAKSTDGSFSGDISTTVLDTKILDLRGVQMKVVAKKAGEGPSDLKVEIRDASLEVRFISNVNEPDSYFYYTRKISFKYQTLAANQQVFMATLADGPDRAQPWIGPITKANEPRDYWAPTPQISSQGITPTTIPTTGQDIQITPVQREGAPVFDGVWREKFEYIPDEDDPPSSVPYQFIIEAQYGDYTPFSQVSLGSSSSTI